MIRLNKIVAHKSKLSRREADKAVLEAKVKVGQKIITNPAFMVDENEKIYLNGKLLKENKEFTVIKYNKPKGEIVSKKDDKNRKLIYHSLPSRFSHFIPIGRLDFASEGILLLTDSSTVANELMNSALPRVYNVKISGNITTGIIEAMKSGYFCKNAQKGAHKRSKITSMEFKPFKEYQIIKNSRNFSKLKITISEGKNREIRRFFGCFDKEVLDLNRVSFGWIELNALPKGKWKFLEKSEYKKLHQFLKDKQ